MSLASARKAQADEFEGEWVENPPLLGGSTLVTSFRDPAYRRKLDRAFRKWKRDHNKPKRVAFEEIPIEDQRRLLAVAMGGTAAKAIRGILVEEGSSEEVPSTEENIETLLLELEDYREHVSRIAAERARAEEDEVEDAAKNLPRGSGGVDGIAVSTMTSDAVSTSCAGPASAEAVSGNASLPKTAMSLPAAGTVAKD